MVLGIISDTHNFAHPEVEAVFADVDLILHAGDVGNPSILDWLAEIAPVRAVHGNIDGSEVRLMAPAHQWLSPDGCLIWMTHIGGRPGRWAKGIGPILDSRRPDVFICGHSHILRIERVPTLSNMLYLNPGAAGRQGFHQVKTCVRLTITNGKPTQAEVVHLDEKTS